MTKAEERALEVYPPKYKEPKRGAKRIQSEKVDTHQPLRTIFIRAYEQAEKDLILTWQDFKLINKIVGEVVTEELESVFQYGGKSWTDEQIYTEVLNRFNEEWKTKIQ